MNPYGMDQIEWRAWAQDQGLSAFRGQQIYDSLWRAPLRSFAEVAGLGRADAQRLDADISLDLPKEVRRQESRDGTVKSLLELHDGNRVECVSIPTEKRHTVCVSSQVGCAVGCTFCASGLNGVQRNLSAAEIVYQVCHHHWHRPVTNVVYMGSGEPMFNYDAVLRSIQLLSEQRGLGLGRRRFTVSTSGVPKKIRQFAEDETRATLALSLHAPDDELRSRLMPINRRWPLQELLAAMDDYSRQVKRRMTFEYVLLADCNMGGEHARRLAQLARRYGAHINLIPFNSVIETPHRAPNAEEVERFFRQVSDAGGICTVRGQRGDDIDAACGQLALRAADSA